jgi:DNA helicase HerA-like ATPase
MFLMKAIQDSYMQSDSDESVAFVIFNVKGRDLMAIDRPNDFSDARDSELAKERTMAAYKNLGLSTEPFKYVKYFIPYSPDGNAKSSTYLQKGDIDDYINCGQLKKYKYIYSSDKASIEMMFSDVEDQNQTMESIISKIIDETDSDFSSLSTWDNLCGKLDDKSKKGSDSGDGISILSYRKFKRIFNKATKGDAMFANAVRADKSECRLTEELKTIKKNDVFVIDIAKLPEDKQAFVFGDAVRTIHNLKLGEYDADSGVEPPSRIVIFVDELNKYASKDIPKTSPILRELLDVTERGRSLGVILFGAEQFRSAIHPRVTGNSATHAYGRTNSIETSSSDYKSLPETYKNMLTRLEQGTYIIQNPVFRSLLKIRFPKPIYKQFKS